MFDHTKYGRNNWGEQLHINHTYWSCIFEWIICFYTVNMFPTSLKASKLQKMTRWLIGMVAKRSMGIMLNRCDDQYHLFWDAETFEFLESLLPNNTNCKVSGYEKEAKHLIVNRSSVQPTNRETTKCCLCC